MLRAALALILLVGCSSTAADVARDDRGRPTEGGAVRADRLRVGDCFDDQDDQSPDDFPVVPCAEPHANEVFETFLAPSGPYPGVDVLTDMATTGCRGAAFAGYVGEPLEGSGFEVFHVLPSGETWGQDGDRTVLCALFRADLALLSGSAARRAPAG